MNYTHDVIFQVFSISIILDICAKVQIMYNVPLFDFKIQKCMSLTSIQNLYAHF
jgi:hypothetical protein